MSTKLYNCGGLLGAKLFRLGCWLRFFIGHVLQWWRSDKVDKEPVQAFSLTLHGKVIHGHSDKGANLSHI